MLEIDIKVVIHHLAIHPSSRPVAQRKQKVGEEKRVAIDEDVGKLFNDKFFTETKYSIWMANMVVVRKANNRWHMCVDFTYMNAIFPKYTYPLSDIDCIIDGSSGYHTLSFMDAYSEYDHIQMNTMYGPKIAFMSNHGNYNYNAMPFGLKITCPTYQPLMDAVFAHQIGRNLEVYTDNMIVKTIKGRCHSKDWEDVL